MTFQRSSGRAPDALRPVSLTRRYTVHAEGSVLVAFGDTKVLCTASVDEKVPPHRRGSGEGWVTAEYGMLPRSTHTRSDREAARGKQSGRTQEIQRLIGRSMRSVFDLAALGERTIHLDCDVLQADGGTRTAAITGAFVAAHDAVSWLLAQGRIERSPIRDFVAAVSVGIVQGVPLLDLEYVEDSACDTDMNVVMTGSGGFVEVQGTAEGVPFQPRRDGCPAGAGAPGHRRTGGGAEGGARLVMRLVLASNNAKKLSELRTLFDGLPLTLVAQGTLGIAEAEEPHATFVENALAKARHAAAACGGAAIADDSGLCVDALGGAPGVVSAQAAGLLPAQVRSRGPAPRPGRREQRLAVAAAGGPVDAARTIRQHAGGPARGRRPRAADRLRALGGADPHGAARRGRLRLRPAGLHRRARRLGGRTDAGAEERAQPPRAGRRADAPTDAGRLVVGVTTVEAYLRPGHACSSARCRRWRCTCTCPGA